MTVEHSGTVLAQERREGGTLSPEVGGTLLWTGTNEIAYHAVIGLSEAGNCHSQGEGG